jgi:hypothetical protein
MVSQMHLLLNASHRPATLLPSRAPLTLTRNFAWVVGFCLAALLIAPLLIAWTASLLLT